MNLKKKAINGVVWSIVEGWSRRIFSYIVFFLLARLLRPEDFGSIALAVSFVSFASIFANQGFATALVQRLEIDPEHLDTAFWTNLALGVMFSLITVGASGLIAELYHQPQLKLVICWLSLTFIINAFKQVQEALLTRQLCFRILAIRSLSVSFIGGILGVIAAFCGLGVWSLVIQQLVGESLGVLVLWQASNWRPGFKFSQKHLQELFSFGINLVGISLLNFVTTNSDNLLIGYFLGPVALGYYTLAYKVYHLILQLLTNITNKVALPVFARMQNDLALLRKAFYQVTQLTSLLAFPICFGVILLAPELVTVSFGEKWLPIVPVMKILGLVGILHSVYQFKVTTITALGKPAWNLRLHLLNSLLDIIAFSIAVRWGIVSVATAYVIRNYLVSPIRLWMIYKLLKINLKKYFHQYIPSLLGSLSIAVFIVVTKQILINEIGSQATLIVSVLISICIYLLTIKLVDPILFKTTFNLFYSILPKSIRSKAST